MEQEKSHHSFDSSEGEDRLIIESNEQSEEEDDEMGLYLKKGEFNVEKIIDVKEINGQKHYFVKWEGYPESENTWEPVGNLQNIAYMVEEFDKEHAEKQSDGKQEGEKEVIKPETQVKAKVMKNKRPKVGFNNEEGEENIVKKVKLDKKEEDKSSQDEVNLNKVASKTASDKSGEEKEKEKEKVKANESNSKPNSSEKTEPRRNKKKPTRRHVKTLDPSYKAPQHKHLAVPEQSLQPTRRRDKAGSFKSKDKPKSILGIKPGKEDHEFFFFVEWEKRGDGVKPENSPVSNEEFRQYNANFLLDFYESKLVIFSRKLAAERREKSMTAHEDLKLNLDDSNINKENNGEDPIMQNKNKGHKEKGMLRERNFQSENQLSKDLEAQNEKMVEEPVKGQELGNIEEFSNTL